MAESEKVMAKTADDMVDRAATPMARVARERARQVELLGWTADHDRHHTVNDWKYLILKQLDGIGIDTPEPDAMQVLTKIGALALAGIDALPEHRKLLDRHSRDVAKREQELLEEQRKRSDELTAARQRAAAEAADQIISDRTAVETLQNRLAELETELTRLRADQAVS